MSYAPYNGLDVKFISIVGALVAVPASFAGDVDVIRKSSDAAAENKGLEVELLLPVTPVIGLSYKLYDMVAVPLVS